jgi:hypothetical protein
LPSAFLSNSFILLYLCAAIGGMDVRTGWALSHDDRYYIGRKLKSKGFPRRINAAA